MHMLQGLIMWVEFRWLGVRVYTHKFINFVTPAISVFYNKFKNGSFYLFVKNLKEKILRYANEFDKNRSAFIEGDDYIIKQNKSLIYNETVNTLYRRQKSTYYSPFISFWPIFLSFSVGLFIIFLLIFLFSSKLNVYSNPLTYITLIGVSVSIAFWFSIFFTEKRKGNHVSDIRRNIELGFYLFLLTEALCFIALFWVFLHSFLAASLHVGLYNPGEGIANLYMNEVVKVSRYWDIYLHHTIGTPSFYRLSSFFTLFDVELFKHKNKLIHINFFDKGQLINPYGYPLLNTLILLTSAATLNASHVALRISKFFVSSLFLVATILLGFFFVYIQYTEYKECTFQYNDGIYAASFFSLTGLHGFHVIIGVSALVVCLINLLLKNYSSSQHQSYVYSIFYWHFVDVIWIFVYIIIYLWPAHFFFKEGINTFYVPSKNMFVSSFNTDFFVHAFEHKIRFLSKKNDVHLFESLLRYPLSGIEPDHTDYLDAKDLYIHCNILFKSQLIKIEMKLPNSLFPFVEEPAISTESNMVDANVICALENSAISTESNMVDANVICALENSAISTESLVYDKEKLNSTLNAKNNLTYVEFPIESILIKDMSHFKLITYKYLCNEYGILPKLKLFTHILADPSSSQNVFNGVNFFLVTKGLFDFIVGGRYTFFYLYTFEEFNYFEKFYKNEEFDSYSSLLYWPFEERVGFSKFYYKFIQNGGYFNYSNYDAEIAYWDCYNDRKWINYNDLKKCKGFKCFFMNVMHQDLVLATENLLYADLKSHYFMTWLSLFLSILNHRLWVIYCEFFYTYLVDHRALYFPSKRKYFF